MLIPVWLCSARRKRDDFCFRLRAHINFTSSQKEIQALHKSDFSLDQYHRALNITSSGQFTMDCSPQYVWFCRVADRLRVHSPSSTLVLLLRNPVEHVISWVNWRLQFERERNVTAINQHELDILSKPTFRSRLQSALSARNARDGMELFVQLSSDVAYALFGRLGVLNEDPCCLKVSSWTRCTSHFCASGSMQAMPTSISLF